MQHIFIGVPGDLQTTAVKHQLDEQEKEYERVSRLFSECIVEGLQDVKGQVSKIQ